MAKLGDIIDIKKGKYAGWKGRLVGFMSGSAVVAPLKDPEDNRSFVVEKEILVTIAVPLEDIDPS